MGKDITTILKESAKDIITDETLTMIKESFDTAVNERVSIHVEKALAEQDAEYTAKLEHLLEALDTDHTNKLTKVVKAIDINNAAKLQRVVEKYSAGLTHQANGFKNTLVKKMSRFIEMYLNKVAPQASINEAVRNNKARIVLENLRGALAVDSTLMKESIKTAVVDGARQIRQSTSEVAKLQQQVEQLSEKLERAQAAIVFEQKTAKLPDQKKRYARRVLEGKSAQFITENIDYTLSLFDKKEEDRLVTLKEEAFTQCVSREHHVIEEATAPTEQQPTFASPHVSNYMAELGKY